MTCAAMSPSPEPKPDDQDLLDDLFDRALARLSQGAPLELDEMETEIEALDPRLRAEARQVLDLAREVTVHHVPRAPTVPGYTILGELGRGAMGTVYLAEQQALGNRRVALKVLPAAATLSPSARERFLREARSLARLRHPNVVAIHDVVRQDELCAYAMEWVEGKPLAQLIDYLKKDNNPSLDDVARFLGCDVARLPEPTLTRFLCRMGVGVARALGEVHRSGLLHRDVKPSNILIRHDGHPLLSDFGLARDPDSSVHTQSGLFVGTLAYAAPEQLRGEPDKLGSRADIYGLGVTLYEALARELPYRGRSQSELLARIEAGLAKPLRRAHPALPQDLETIVAKAMDPDPPRRYATADELADDLERLLNLQPIAAKPVRLWVRMWKAVRRQRIVLAGAITGALVMLLVAAGIGLRWKHRLNVPELVHHKLIDARLSLLSPLHGEQVFLAAHWGRRPEKPQGSQNDLEAALARYREALDFGPDNAAPIQRERNVVELALALLDPERPLEAIAGALERDCPLTVLVAREWRRGRGPPQVTDDELAEAATADLRQLGLLCLLCGDALLCNKAWDQLDLTQDPDPFVDLSLGELYLALDRGNWAYARLRTAFRELSTVGFVCVDLADAAVRCGALSEAERLLERAPGLERHDPFETLERVQADLLAARGAAAEAEAAYRAFLTRHQAPTARLHLARLLVRQAKVGQALDALLELVRTRPGVPLYAEELARTTAVWWTGLGRNERWQVCREAPDGVCIPSSQTSLFDLLEALAKGADNRVAPRNSPESANRPGALFSPYLQLSDLLAIAHSLEDTRMNAHQLKKYPPLLKTLLAHAWLSPLPRPAAGLVCHVARAWQAIRPILAPMAVIGTLFFGADLPVAQAQRQEGDWVSVYGDIHNSRRAPGQKVGSHWQERWRSPRTGYGGVLVSDGMAIFQNNPAEGNQFAAVDIATGAVVWSKVVGDTARKQHSRGGCVLNSRLFLPLSTEGSGSSGDWCTSRIECREATTGNHRWTWDSGIIGTLGHLQGLDVTLVYGTPVVLVTVYDHNGSAGGYNLRIAVLDADFTGTGTFVGATGPYLEESAPESGQKICRFVSLFPEIAGDTIIWHAFSHVKRRHDLPSYYNWCSLAIRDFVLPGLGLLRSYPLSDTTLSDQAWSTSLSPVVVNGSDGYVCETGGLLHAVDLSAKQEQWSRAITTSFTQISPLVLDSTVITVDYQATEGIASYDRLTGQKKWSATPPALPLYQTGCILDDQLILCGLVNGDAYAIEDQGLDSMLYGPLHNEPNLLSQDGNRGLFAAAGVYFVPTDTELICYEATSPLVLGIWPHTVVAGNTIRFNACGGDPGKPGLLVVVDINGTAMFRPLLPVTLDGNGRWGFSATVPPGFAGLDVTFRLYAAAEPLGVHITNDTQVQFR
ncbi:MAG: serine/threonine-protein kinase [Planctomycetota bacterium]